MCEARVIAYIFLLSCFQDVLSLFTYSFQHVSHKKNNFKVSIPFLQTIPSCNEPLIHLLYPDLHSPMLAPIWRFQDCYNYCLFKRLGNVHAPYSIESNSCIFSWCSKRFEANRFPSHNCKDLPFLAPSAVFGNSTVTLSHFRLDWCKK